MPVVPNDFVKIFNGELNTEQDEAVLTVLGNCNRRAFVCYGYSCNFRNNDHEPPPPFDFIEVKKMRRGYYNQGKKCLAVPSSAYFNAFCDNSFFQPFGCIQRKHLTFSVTQLKVYNKTVDVFTPQRLALLRNLQLFEFLY